MHTVELINHGARVWATTRDNGLWEDIALPHPTQGVSVISYDIPDHGPIESILPIFQDDEIPTLQRWREIIQNARQYQWAEQEGFAGRFQNWPRSYYVFFLTNSRTFIREMVRLAGLPWREMAPGRFNHPGLDAPAQNDHPTHILWPDTPPHIVN